MLMICNDFFESFFLKVCGDLVRPSGPVLCEAKSCPKAKSKAKAKSKPQAKSCVGQSSREAKSTVFVSDPPP